MTRIAEQCVYKCGPYQGYSGRAEYDPEDKSFHGEVIGTRDMITFAGDTFDELAQAFQDSVDDYLSFCESLKKAPEKPFSGRFLARIKPETHRKLSTMAELAGKSLNALVSDCLDSAVAATPPFEIAGMPDESVGRKSPATGKKKGAAAASNAAKPVRLATARSAKRSPAKPRKSRRRLA
jgi:predicted HicB family RNase H-like nuclease